MPTTAAIPHAHTESDIKMARNWAGLYREMGWNPLPTRPDEKRPFIRYSEYWEQPYPAAQFERFRTGSLQLMTGRRWGLVVIDLDGPEAIEHWESVATGLPRTWVTHSGGDGKHLWYAVPPDGPPIRSGRLWGVWEPDANEGRGDWRKHVAIEVIGDRKLIVAPPSIHPKTGKRYRFLSGHSPKTIARPAAIPPGLLRLPILGAPGRASIPMPPTAIRTGPIPPGLWDRRAVLDAVRDKTSVARSYGLRVATGPNASGWCACHAVGREDRDPSASFNPASGSYWESALGSITFFDLLVALGAYPDWKSAVADLGHRYGVQRSA